MVKLFRQADQGFTPTGGGAVPGLVNTSYSAALGAGIGTFEDRAIEWTVTDDEVLFIMAGELTLRVGGDAYRAGAGDVPWIPKDTALVYEAGGKVTFFHAVRPAGKPLSTGKPIDYPSAGWS